MKKYRRVWDTTKDNWIKQHKHLRREESYELFLQAFPGSSATKNAYDSRCRFLGCLIQQRKSKTPTNIKPLYSEKIKKGYVQIKVAQPSVWISKAQWVYTETHPWEDCTEPSRYFFLDGDKRNFSPDNIARIPNILVGIFSKMGGTADGNPELTKLRIIQARLKHKLLDISEKEGLAYRTKNGARVFLKTPFKNKKR